jgi:hypothetical protein
MRSQPTHTYGIVIIFLLLSFHANALQSRGQGSKSDNWELCTICGIPSRMALNAFPGPTLVPRRNIYLLIEGSDLKEENLRNAFETLSTAYPDPILLSIIAFSNKESLRQLITAEEGDSVIDFADTLEGRMAERQYNSERYPPRTGYFRAYYLRSAIDRESFQYTPNPAEERTIEVILKTRTGRKNLEPQNVSDLIGQSEEQQGIPCQKQRPRGVRLDFVDISSPLIGTTLTSASVDVRK